MIKKITFVCKGIPREVHNSNLHNTVHNILDKEFKLISYFLEEDHSLFKNNENYFYLNNDKTKIVVKINKLNLVQKILSFFLIVFKKHLIFEKKNFLNLTKGLETDLVICFNWFSGYFSEHICSKKILFIGERQKILYQQMIINNLKIKLVTGILFLLKNIFFFIFIERSNMKLIKKFSRVYCWPFNDFIYFLDKGLKNVNYLENPLSFEETDKFNLEKDYELKKYKDIIEEKNKFNFLIVGHLKATHQIEGFHFFFNKVVPLLIKRNLFDKMNIFIIGKYKADKYTKKISNFKNVFFTGFVKNIKYFYENCDCNLLVTKPDLGNRHRISDFWFNKTFVISRTSQNYYPQLIHDFNCLVSKNENDLVEQISKFMDMTVEERNKIVDNGYKTCLSFFSINSFKNKLIEIIKNV